MRIRVERLRVWLLASAGLLLVVIVGFMAAARYLRRHWVGLLPGKLAANVRIDSSGITKSFTHDGHTDYVVHAGKYVERKDGKAELHDVWIKLCGRRQQRADMVRGDDWEWDQKAGVIRAVGLVHIELRPAAAGQSGCTATDDAAAAGASTARTVRVTTSDLVYMDKLGVAATSAPIDFQSGPLAGHAVGADYSSDAGTLMLHSAVSMTGTTAGRPIQLHAASAEMDGQQRVLRLQGASYATGAGTSARTATADQAVLHLREDQTLERIQASGNVTLQQDAATVRAAEADLAMNAAGNPVSALLTGGVQYRGKGADADRQGEAAQADISFDGKASPQAQHAVFAGGVRFVQKPSPAGAGASPRRDGKTRDLSAAKLEVWLEPDAGGKNVVRDMDATGGAKFIQKDTASAAGVTEMAADDLKAHFAPGPSQPAAQRLHLETIAGRGHTMIHQINAQGVEQTSTGDQLNARFRAVATRDRTVPRPDSAFDDDLASAVQTGQVVVTRRDPPNIAKGRTTAAVQNATAQQVSYDGDSDRLTLEGAVQFSQSDKDGESRLWASRMVLDHATGNADASGSVRAEYTQTAAAANNAPQKPQDPAHVLADRAELDHVRDTATFHGSPVRMWQNGSQLQAPVVEMARTAKQLSAHGENAAGRPTDGAQAVHMVLVNQGAATEGAPTPPGRTQGCQAAGAGQATPVAGRQAQVFRIASGALTYSGIRKEAQFTGGFRVETPGAQAVTTIRASTGAVYLKDTSAGAASAEAMPLQGSVDRMTAGGGVVVDQAGLRATGDNLLYTAAAGSFLLAGNAGEPARATDARGSSTTGAALRFRQDCGAAGDTLEVLSTMPGMEATPAAKVHTESRIQPRTER